MVRAQQDVGSDVGLTALFVAAARSAETARADRLLRDELAGAFVAAAPTEVPLPVDGAFAAAGADTQYWSVMTDYLALRTRFLDECVTDAGLEQVVIVAAGLDARAFRLGLIPSTRIFELDRPGVLAFKQQVLDAQRATPAGERRAVPAELTGDWTAALRAAGFAPERPTVWVVEGLLPYLSAATEERLFERIHELSAPGSLLAVERTGAQTAAIFRDNERIQESQRHLGVALADVVNLEPRRDPKAWLRSAGWAVTSTSMASLQDAYGREFVELREHIDDVEMITAWRG